MPREYKHIKEYEKEIPELKEPGLPLREIGERFGLSYEQFHNFLSRHNERQRRIAAGIAIRKKGRPAKETMVTDLPIYGISWLASKTYGYRRAYPAGCIVSFHHP